MTDVQPSPTLEQVVARLAALEARLPAGPAPQAAPPMTIGPFTNVPAPGSPIRSDWPQQLTQYVWDWVPNLARVVSNAGTGSKIVVQARDSVVTTNASGDGSVVFPETMPSMPTVVLVHNTIDDVNLALNVNLYAVRTTGFDFRARRNENTAYAGAIRVSYIAVAYKP